MGNTESKGCTTCSSASGLQNAPPPQFIPLSLPRHPHLSALYFSQPSQQKPTIVAPHYCELHNCITQYIGSVITSFAKNANVFPQYTQMQPVDAVFAHPTKVSSHQQLHHLVFIHWMEKKVYQLHFDVSMNSNTCQLVQVK
jgi:hypothetical protein